MKKITFILFALISGTSFAQTATADVKAEIVSPIAIVSSNSLNFGKIAATTSAGTVTLSPSGSISYSDKAGMAISSVATSVPTFTVTNAGNAYQITLPGNVEITEDGGQIMKLTNFKTGLPSNSGVLVNEFNLGATLEVGVDQAVGVYEGDVVITVSYE